MTKIMKWLVLIIILFCMSIALVIFELRRQQPIVTQQIEEVDEPIIPPKIIEVPPTPPVVVSTSTPQFVLLAFDGSRSLDMWQSTVDFAEELSKVTAFPVRFTYFISGVYYLTGTHRTQYISPGNQPGSSLIGFGTTNNEVATRMKLTALAQAHGHEIGSHANGHFVGTPWTREEWKKEFEQFQTFTNDPATFNNLETPTDWIDTSKIKGFRAPNLGTNSDMFALLPEFGFTYDTSATSAKMDAWPVKNKFGTWQFFLPSISRGNGKRVLAMDYNFFVAHSSGTDLITRTDPRWQEFHDDMLDAYRRYFKNNYNGNRAPVYIGHHFSLWNDDVYYEVFKDFAREVCVLPEVRCTTYTELVDFLNEKNKNKKSEP